MKMLKSIAFVLAMLTASSAWALPDTLILSGDIQFEQKAVTSIIIYVEKYKDSRKKSKFRGEVRLGIDGEEVTRTLKLKYKKRKNNRRKRG